MPVFNAGSYLHAALKSISRQSFADFEFIVVDDGSTDGSTRVLRLFADEEKRMRLVVRGNLGLVASRNELLAAARGELVAWMDSDDISLPDRLQRQIAAFNADPTLVCLGSAAQCVDPDGNHLNVERYPSDHEEILVAQQQGGAMRFPTTMMRRDTALLVGAFREPFRIGEDFDLLLRLSEVGKMANLPHVLYIYRQRLGSACAQFGSHWIVYRDHILELARQRRSSGRDQLQSGVQLTIAAPIPTNQRQVKFRVYISWAAHALAGGNDRLAWKYAFAAIRQLPLATEGWKTALRIALFRAKKSYQYVIS
jgi:glycosyltransferase involved in cell wall biosynthesis